MLPHTINAAPNKPSVDTRGITRIPAAYLNAR
jgi:hypothetical protein